MDLEDLVYLYTLLKTIPNSRAEEMVNKIGELDVPFQVKHYAQLPGSVKLYYNKNV